MKWILAIICLNLAIWLVMAKTEAGEHVFAGASYVERGPHGGVEDVEAWEKRFNASSVAEGWSAKVFNIPILGDLFSGFGMIWDAIRFAVDGFPALVQWFGDLHAEASWAFSLVAHILRAITSIMAATLLWELITGRQILD